MYLALSVTHLCISLRALLSPGSSTFVSDPLSGVLNCAFVSGHRLSRCSLLSPPPVEGVRQCFVEACRVGCTRPCDVVTVRLLVSQHAWVPFPLRHCPFASPQVIAHIALHIELFQFRKVWHDVSEFLSPATKSALCKRVSFEVHPTSTLRSVPHAREVALRSTIHRWRGNSPQRRPLLSPTMCLPSPSSCHQVKDLSSHTCHSMPLNGIGPPCPLLAGVKLLQGGDSKTPS